MAARHQVYVSKADKETKRKERKKTNGSAQGAHTIPNGETVFIATVDVCTGRGRRVGGSR